jgi:hypothetical protein
MAACRGGGRRPVFTVQITGRSGIQLERILCRRQRRRCLGQRADFANV